MNEPPTALNLTSSSLTLPTTAGTLIGTLSAVDPDQNEQFQFILTDNAGGKFQIQGTNLVVGDPNQFIWNSRSEYTVKVLVLDHGGQSFERTFTIDVTV